MIELNGLMDPNGSTTNDINRVSIRQEIISRSTLSGEPIFLAVTKKWRSSMWQGTYIKKKRNRSGLYILPSDMDDT